MKKQDQIKPMQARFGEAETDQILQAAQELSETQRAGEQAKQNDAIPIIRSWEECCIENQKRIKELEQELQSTIYSLRDAGYFTKAKQAESVLKKGKRV